MNDQSNAKPVPLQCGVEVSRAAFEGFFATLGDFDEWVKANPPNAYAISTLSAELQTELQSNVPPASLLALWTEFEPFVTQTMQPATVSAMRAAMGRLTPALVRNLTANMDDATRERAAELARAYRLAHGL